MIQTVPTITVTRSILVYFLAFVPAGLALLVASMQTVVPLAFLMKDPLAVAELTKADCCHVYYGLFSNFGILLWCGTAAITLFSALILFVKGARSSDFVPLTAVGLFTTWLMLDDFFLVHEDVLPAFGISQVTTYAFYACLGILYLAATWRTILQNGPILLLISLGLLGLSVVSDVVLHTESYLHVLVEDGAKLFGISAWAAFHINLAVSKLDHALARRSIPFSPDRLGLAMPQAHNRGPIYE
ncbi:MAG: hypothetical protein K0U74_17170 [Alphaproteobacteria bacterium]|nr:hypothetical protein [Alphaproteobacteria bacterium]